MLQMNLFLKALKKLGAALIYTKHNNCACFKISRISIFVILLRSHQSESSAKMIEHNVFYHCQNNAFNCGLVCFYNDKIVYVLYICARVRSRSHRCVLHFILTHYISRFRVE